MGELSPKGRETRGGVSGIPHRFRGLVRKRSSSLKKTRLQERFASVTVGSQEQADAISARSGTPPPGPAPDFTPRFGRLARNPSLEPVDSQHLWGEVVFRTLLSKAAVLCYPDNTWIWREKPKEGRRCSKQQFCAGLTRFQKAKFQFFF